MVSILLLLTILYCVRLNKQLRLLKADEQSLRATISELVTATEIAERAIAGLKVTMRDGEQVLGPRLQRIETLSSDLERQIAAGEGLLGKISRIAGIASDDLPLAPRPDNDVKAVAAAAQRFAERARARQDGRAA
ncbi:MAG TPA: DUF6468 domain-containing protein [Pseudolabrys sp.]|nr:DUF6468 domain-containing protein [Pseudolabrys sp.]